MPYYFGALLIVFTIYILLFKRFYYSVLDPMVISFVGSALACTIVVFLYIDKVINDYYFFSFFFSQCAFLFCFLFFGKRNVNQERIRNSRMYNDNIHLNFSIFIISSFVFVVSQLIVYVTAGIPLFMDSRLETFVGGSGFGIFSRILDVSGFVSLFMIFNLYNSDKKLSNLRKKLLYFICVFFVIAAVLSGSKSYFLLIGQTYFTYAVTSDSNLKINKIFKSIKKYELKIVLLGLIVAMIVIKVQSSAANSFSDALTMFGYRLIGFGDVFWYAYPNGTIERMVYIDKQFNPFFALFSDFLGMFRLIPWDELPNAIGLDLYNMHHKTSAIIGPNARQNVFGYIYFGYSGSIVFSAIIGIVTGLCRKYFFQQNAANIYKKIFIALLYIKIFTLEYDPLLGLTYLNSMFIFLPIIFFLSKIYYDHLLSHLS